MILIVTSNYKKKMKFTFPYNGVAAGRVSAIAAKKNKLPVEVKWQETSLG
jgi:hypothetical protein